jgi:hypothetical protein
MLLLVVASLFFGEDLTTLVSTEGAPAAPSPEQDALADFVSVVLADTEDTWARELPAQQNMPYQPPRLVLFSGSVPSACGHATAAVGPFYCPADQQMYIDLEFYRDLETRFGAAGDFAQAYVIAHEVGHHIQTLTGTSRQVQAARARSSEQEGNLLSVRLELQADCYAGVWAHHAQAERRILHEGDIEEAMNAAAAIGDDRLQRQGRGAVVPESFTHGTSEQRMRWFRVGFDSGSMARCNTFDVAI